MRRYIAAREAYRNGLADAAENVKRLTDSDLTGLFLELGNAGNDSLTEREQRLFTILITEITTRFPRLVEERDQLLVAFEEEIQANPDPRRSA
jgi:hypothetical protein